MKKKSFYQRISQITAAVQRPTRDTSQRGCSAVYSINSYINTITKSRHSRIPITWIICCITIVIFLQLMLFIHQSAIFDPGLVFYIYEPLPGLLLLIFRIIVWGVFKSCCYRTSRKTTTEFHFYASLLFLGSIWFLCHPLTALAITFSVDKWVRESMVKGCSLWMIFLGHAVFSFITRPASSNARVPFHIRTFQVMPINVGQSHNYEPRRSTAAPTNVQHDRVEFQGI